MNIEQYTNIVNADDLARHINSPHWVIIDCRFRINEPEYGQLAYLRGHIAGARYAHLDKDMSGSVTTTSGRHPLPDPRQLADKLGRWGIGTHTQVVLYDDQGGAIAARLWWLLRWLGHNKVAVLNGGLQAWQQIGHLVTSSLAEAAVPNLFHYHLRNEMQVSVEDVLRNLQRQTKILLDARNTGRFRGEQETVDIAAGHVPGAINLPYEGNLDKEGKLLPADKLQERFSLALGTHSPRDVIMMCGSGVTACHNLLAMAMTGMDGGALYVGSWSEWIRDSKRPREIGP